MSLREAYGADVERIYELVDRLLDSPDGVLVLMDAQRTVSYSQGFGLSPCQLELLALQFERTLALVRAGPAITR